MRYVIYGLIDPNTNQLRYIDYTTPMQPIMARRKKTNETINRT